MDNFKNLSNSNRSSRVLVWGRIVLFALALFVITVYTLAWTGWDDNHLSQSVDAQTRRRSSQFEFSQLSVPESEIHSGGPGKDGIPALSNPTYLEASKANSLLPNDQVIGVVLENEARAYPLRILSFHEIVNDTIGETPVAVTYCPLCDSSVVFDRRTPIGVREFGVSGLLYNSNVLMYDRGGTPESLWSQLLTTGISGAGINKKLRTLPVEVTTWKSWSARYPQTLVLSNETGHRRDYRSAIYQSYFQSPNLMFPVNRTDNRLPAKTPVLGVWTKNAAKAFPITAFSAEALQVRQQIGGKSVTFKFDSESRSLRVVEADPGVEWMYSFWFAWAASRPETTLYETDSPKHEQADQ